MTNEMVMFLLQGGLAVIMLFFGFILNGMRASIDGVNTDLKGLNDAVLGKYLTRDESASIWAAHRSETDNKWTAQRTLDHELRSLITASMIDAAKASGKPYSYGSEEKPK